MSNAEIKFGPVTRWLLEQGFEMRVSFESTHKGLVERISLTKGDEKVDGSYENIEMAASRYVKSQIRLAKSKLLEAERKIEFWTHFAKQLGVINE